MSWATRAEPKSTDDLALSASMGDLDALGDLYEHFADPLLRYLTLRTQNNLTLAEDIAANTWEKVARAIRDYRPKGNGFEAWLFTIARRSLAEHFRWSGRRPERLEGEMLAYDQADGSETPAELVDRKFLSHQIAAELRGLPGAQRKCVVLRFFVGLSLAETAAVMDKNVNTVKQLQYRALRLLKQRLGETVFRDSALPDVVTQTDYRTTIINPNMSTGGMA